MPETSVPKQSSFLDFQERIKDIAISFAKTIGENQLNNNQIAVQKEIRPPNRETSFVLNLHRPKGEGERTIKIAGCFPEHREAQKSSFVLTPEDEVDFLCNSPFPNFNSILSSISVYLDKLINGEALKTKTRSHDVQSIINAAFEENNALEELSKTQDINIRFETHSGNAITRILDELFSPDIHISDSDITIPSLEKRDLEKAAIKLLDHGAIPDLRSGDYLLGPLGESIKHGLPGIALALIRNGFYYEAKYACEIGYDTQEKLVSGNLVDLAYAHNQPEVAQAIESELNISAHLDDSVEFSQLL